MRLKQLVKLGAQLCGVSVPSDLDTAQARTDMTVSLPVDCCNLLHNHAAQVATQKIMEVI